MYLKVIFIFLLMLAPFFALKATPGNLDYRGGHNCWQNCEQYGLFPGQYHIETGTERYRSSR